MVKIKIILINIALVILSISFILFLIESITRLVYKNHYFDNLEFRLSRPEPYNSSEYFSKDFIYESFEQPGKWINPPNTRIIYPSNFSGKYFKVENNFRYTSDFPDSFDNKVYLFGGSTIYNSEVPDKYTIASYLQRLFNLNFPNKFRVINCGVTSINTLQQLEKLKSIQIDSGDIICFYGGVNDAILFNTGRVNGWIMGENYIEYSSKMNLLQKIRFKAYNRFGHVSRFIRIFFDPYSYQTPIPLRNMDNVKVLQSELFHSYVNSVKTADSICNKSKAAFYNFLQPHLLTRNNRTTYEQNLFKLKQIVPPPFITALSYSYPVLKQSNVALLGSGIKSYDFTSILNITSESLFLDLCHVTEKANEIIATEIFKKIKL